MGHTCRLGSRRRRRKSPASSSSASTPSYSRNASTPAAPTAASGISTSSCQSPSRVTGPSSPTSILACPREASWIPGAKPTGSFGTSSGRQAGESKYLRSLGTSNISTAPSAFSRPGQPETRQRPRQKRRGCGKPSLMPIGTPSNAMAASTPSWIRSTKRRRKHGPRPEQDGSTISASGGQSGVAVSMRHRTRPSGARRWRMLLTTTTLRSQRAQPSLLWWSLYLEIRVGHGLAWIPRVLCDKTEQGGAPRVPSSPGASARRTRGVLVEGATPPFCPLVRHETRLTGARSGARLTLASGGSLPP